MFEIFQAGSGNIRLDDLKDQSPAGWHEVNESQSICGQSSREINAVFFARNWGGSDLGRW